MKPVPSLAPYQRHVARLEAIPEALRGLPIWCAWRLIPKPEGKPGKMPVSPITGRSEGWTQPGFCVTAAEAIAYADSHPELTGVGLVVGNGLSGGDLDGCIVDGQPSPLAQGIINAALTYTEVSPGLNGYRFLFFGSFGGHTGNDRDLGVEFYEDNRFLTFTGLRLGDVPATVEQRDLTALGSCHFGRKEQSGDGKASPKSHVHHDLDRLPVKISDKLKQLIRQGAPRGERSEAVFAAARDLIHAGIDDLTACHILTDPEYRISEKAFAERKNNIISAMKWTMQHNIVKARNEMVKEQAVVGGLFGQAGQQQTPEQPVFDGAIEDWPWEPPVDIFDETAVVPPYTPGMLTPVYEAMMEANYRHHSLATRELYAGLFALSVDCHLRPSVRVEEKPGNSNAAGDHMFSFNEQFGAVGPSTKGKTPTFMHAVGNEGEQSVLGAWQQKEASAVAAKFKVKADEIRKQFKGDEAAIKVKLAELKEMMPMPDIINSKITDKALINTNSVNDKIDVPTNILIDEWENVYGGSAYRRDGGNSMSDLHRKMHDNFGFQDKTHGGGKIETARMGGNVGFTCTPSDMADWSGYEAAMKNGDMARKNLFAPGVTFDGERDKTIDKEPIAAWRAVQEKLHELSNLRVTFEVDDEFDTITDAQIGKWSYQADHGDHVVRWLCKSKIRAARMAGRLFLVEEIVAGRKPAGTVVVPKAYRRRAWKFITQFAWPHQEFVHRRLIAGEEFKTALQVLLRRVVVNRKTVLKSDEIAGGGASVSMRRGGEEFVKALLFSYNWIRPKATRKAYNRQRPWDAGQFEVNPDLFKVYEQYEERLKQEHEVAKGQIRDIDWTT